MTITQSVGEPRNLRAAQQPETFRGWQELRQRVEGVIVELPGRPIHLGKALEKLPKRKRAALVEECLKIDCADLRRSAVFRHGESGRLIWTLGPTEIATARFAFTSQSSDAGELAIELQRGNERRRARLVLTTTSPAFGGVRFWFQCPQCSQRTRTLFVTEQELDPACRGCHGLQYRSAQDHDARVDQLRKDESKMRAMLQHESGTLAARLRRAKLLAKVITNVEWRNAKKMRY